VGTQVVVTNYVSRKTMTHPLEVEGTRICVLNHSDEVVTCANLAGFKALSAWMSWLADSRPDELYHFHLLWSLESEVSRFESIRPRNVWFLRTPETKIVNVAPPDCMEPVSFDITFQVLTESALDELALAQESGFIPQKYLKAESSYVGDCG
jgi:hypothetical protein